MEKQIIRVRKVGAVTFGMVLVITGILYLLRLFVPEFDCRMIFHFWPVILIGLGTEVLIGSRWKNFEIRDGEGKLIEVSRVVYDVPAIILTIVLTGFSMIMGIMDWAFTHAYTIHI